MENTGSIRKTAITVGILALIAIFLYTLLDVGTTGANPQDRISTFTTRFLGIFIEAAPFLLLGSLFSGLIEVYVSREDLFRVLPKNPILATIAGAFMGLAFPVCECGVVPVTRRLFTKGLPMSVGIAFMLAAPVMNPIVFVSTFIAFGWTEIIVLRFVVTAVVAISIGLIFATVARPHETLLPISFAPVRGGNHGALSPKSTQKSLFSSLYRACRVASDEFFEMGRFLIIGSLLAAWMQTRVSQQDLISIGSGVVLSVLAMQALAFVLSLCSTVDAFLALSFLNTFTTGSLVAFLTFGPMVDIKSAMMFAGVFKKKIVAYLVILPFLMTLLVGILINIWMMR
ncbi:MAG: permease [Phototrophicales bacterium]|nr:permease [Phototrophicales bacterium]